MAENGSELRSIAWSQAFPFMRLFRTLRLALNVNRLILALVCVVLCYIGGRLLDATWGAGGGVAVMPHEGGVRTEIQVYAATNHGEFNTWLREARHAPQRTAILALVQAGKAANEDEARRTLANHKLRELLLDDDFRRELTELNTLVDELLQTGLDGLNKDTKLSKADRAEKHQSLIANADTVRRMLSGTLPQGASGTAQGPKAIEALIAADPATRADNLARLTATTTRQAQVRLYEQLRPRGPFISLLKHEQHCFAAAIQGACAGRWGFAGRAYDAEPSMIGSIDSALRGGCWLVIRHPWYALFFLVFNLLVFAYFGGAICRSAAVQSARDESIAIGDSLAFVAQRYSGFVLAPVIPIAILIGIAVVMFFGGLIGAIPYLGELITGVFYPLALLGGFAAALVLLALGLGFHLMWPTIAVEGSDGFDALSRACSYVGSRIFHVAFYAFVLLLYGAASFFLVRLVIMLMLKLAHLFTGLGMDLVSSAELSGTGKLNALWLMPAWSELTLLPSTSGTPLAGTFANGPLDSTETLATWLLMAWVYLTVTLLGAFVVNFFFCGSTQMYFLLRRSVDATDWEEIYYEEPEEQAPPPVPTAPVAPTEPSVPSEPSEPSEPAPPAPPPADSAGPENPPV